MKVLILYQGDYGKRFWDNIGGHPPIGWQVSWYHFTKRLPTFVDELSDYLPRDLPSCDLLILVHEHPAVA